MSVFMARKKYYAVFIVKQHGTYVLLRKKRIRPTTKNVRYMSGKSKVVKIDTPTYQSGLRNYYFIDVNGEQVNFEGQGGEVLSMELIDMVLEQSTIRQLSSSLNDKFLGGQLFTVIMAFGIGLLLGWIIAGFF